MLKANVDRFDREPGFLNNLELWNEYRALEWNIYILIKLLLVIRVLDP